MITSTPVSVSILSAGYCLHPELLTLKGGTIKPVAFPAGYALLRHPQHGPILFDTGYSSRFFEETAKLPASLYRHITPVVFKEGESAVERLREAGIAPEEIRYMVLSHFHADHIGGVRDFPKAQFIYLRKSYEAVHRLSPIKALRAGFLPGLLPEDFTARSLPVDEYSSQRPLPPGFPFTEAYDLLGDGSLLAVEMSGHAAGMIGLFVSGDGYDYLLCADTVWSSRAFRENRRPHPAAGLIMSDRKEYRHNFDRLRVIHENFPGLRIVPSHCREALALWGTGGVR
ncbi:metal-dependent hydrolase, beta-lactamase superfamily II [Paenibacillus riograndensis]|uniref:Metal-dependent hydrolase, beta-lactamase superfamily II n=1 Tax=Paenibacillus riograndensis TaxID=483937 RepID=A0A132U341_9BACL|nr:MBL fold metallo-hydrolase [Paenibacillus riograndensis]KWX77958.1 metal-dependent hydrolase, beta-lactamase superfamily II [Paenibacillus riograndensis]